MPKGKGKKMIPIKKGKDRETEKEIKVGFPSEGTVQS